MYYIYTILSLFIGGGNGNPLQYSCLENPHGQRSLEGYSPWGCKKLDVTEVTQHACVHTYLYYTISKEVYFFTYIILSLTITSIKEYSNFVMRKREGQIGQVNYQINPASEWQNQDSKSHLCNTFSPTLTLHLSTKWPSRQGRTEGLLNCMH